MPVGELGVVHLNFAVRLRFSVPGPTRLFLRIYNNLKLACVIGNYENETASIKHESSVILKLSKRYLYLSCFILAQAHGVLLVEGATRVEVMHLNSSIADYHLWRSSLSGASLHGGQLGVAGAARLHVVRVDR